MSQDPFAGSLPRDVGFLTEGRRRARSDFFWGVEENRKSRSVFFFGEARAA